MEEKSFYYWLSVKFTGGTPNSRLANCHRVEQFEGDLDEHFGKDKGASLLNKLAYSKEDQRAKREANHNIRIDGDIYTGTSTLKQAVKLYFSFKSGEEPNKTNRRQLSAALHKRKAGWPTWEHPDDEELYEIVKLTTKYIKFLHPDIIYEIVNDNKQYQDKWSKQLKNRKILPEIYLWEKSPCAFPGVRRYAGSKEIAYFRKHAQLSDHEITDAARLDDNDFPKHIWSYIFRGNKFQKNGPKNYALAHLADHKEYKNRLYSEFDIQKPSEKHKLFGLFTCPTNTAYIPTSLLRPTDFSAVIRKLLIGKSYDLYGDFCNVLPPWINLNFDTNDQWDQSHFKWSEPVGNMENIKLFLEFRHQLIESILAT
jgi:hypothetical protein